MLRIFQWEIKGLSTQIKFYIGNKNTYCNGLRTKYLVFSISLKTELHKLNVQLHMHSTS